MEACLESTGQHRRLFATRPDCFSRLRRSGSGRDVRSGRAGSQLPPSSYFSSLGLQRRTPPNKGSQLTTNSSFQSAVVEFWRRAPVRRRLGSALFVAAEARSVSRHEPSPCVPRSRALRGSAAGCALRAVSARAIHPVVGGGSHHRGWRLALPELWQLLLRGVHLRSSSRGPQSSRGRSGSLHERRSPRRLRPPVRVAVRPAVFGPILPSLRACGLGPSSTVLARSACRLTRRCSGPATARFN